MVQHPPRGNVYLVHIDSAAGDPSYAGGECEEGDGQGVVAADINHSHEEGCRRQQSCREIDGGGDQDSVALYSAAQYAPEGGSIAPFTMCY